MIQVSRTFAPADKTTADMLLCYNYVWFGSAKGLPVALSCVLSPPRKAASPHRVVPISSSVSSVVSAVRDCFVSFVTFVVNAGGSHSVHRPSCSTASSTSSCGAAMSLRQA